MEAEKERAKEELRKARLERYKEELRLNPQAKKKKKKGKKKGRKRAPLKLDTEGTEEDLDAIEEGVEVDSPA